MTETWSRRKSKPVQLPITELRVMPPKLCGDLLGRPSAHSFCSISTRSSARSLCQAPRRRSGSYGLRKNRTPGLMGNSVLADTTHFNLWTQRP